jgi:hypothetical protein
MMWRYGYEVKVFKLAPWMMMGNDNWCKTMNDAKEKNHLCMKCHKICTNFTFNECIQYVKHHRIFSFVYFDPLMSWRNFVCSHLNDVTRTITYTIQKVLFNKHIYIRSFPCSNLWPFGSRWFYYRLIVTITSSSKVLHHTLEAPITSSNKALHDTLEAPITSSNKVLHHTLEAPITSSNKVLHHTQEAPITSNKVFIIHWKLGGSCISRTLSFYICKASAMNL